VGVYLTFGAIVLETLFLVFFFGLFFVKIKGKSPVERMKLWEDRVGSIYNGLAYKEAFINRL
jgi:hypothetical protein